MMNVPIMYANAMARIPMLMFSLLPTITLMAMQTSTTISNATGDIKYLLKIYNKPISSPTFLSEAVFMLASYSFSIWASSLSIL